MKFIILSVSIENGGRLDNMSRPKDQPTKGDKVINEIPDKTLMVLKYEGERKKLNEKRHRKKEENIREINS